MTFTTPLLNKHQTKIHCLVVVLSLFREGLLFVSADHPVPVQFTVGHRKTLSKYRILVSYSSDGSEFLVHGGWNEIYTPLSRSLTPVLVQVPVCRIPSWFRSLVLRYEVEVL